MINEKSLFCNDCNISVRFPFLFVYRIPKPHYGKFCCSGCGRFIEWCNKDEVSKWLEYYTKRELFEMFRVEKKEIDGVKVFFD